MLCEHLVMGRETWHEQAGQPGWLEWCVRNRGRLAQALLARLERGDNARDFFGSWYEVEGFRQCGYYLGHEIVREMGEGDELRNVALLPPSEVDVQLAARLRALAASSGG